MQDSLVRKLTGVAFQESKFAEGAQLELNGRGHWVAIHSYMGQGGRKSTVAAFGTLGVLSHATSRGGVENGYGVCCRCTNQHVVLLNGGLCSTSPSCSCANCWGSCSVVCNTGAGYSVSGQALSFVAVLQAVTAKPGDPFT